MYFYNNEIMLPDWFMGSVEKAWKSVGVSFAILRHPSAGHYCGYCIFPNQFMKEDSYHGILTYVPVHGGITLAEYDEGMMVYGFDCAHIYDDQNPLTRDINWLTQEAEKMAQCIRIAALYEDEYLAFDEDEREARLEVLTKYAAHLDREGINSSGEMSFGMMINMLSGRV